MITFTREHLIAAWERWGDGEPLSDEKITGMLKVLNEPIRLPERPITLCGEPPSRPFYSFHNVHYLVDSRTWPIGSIEPV